MIASPPKEKILIIDDDAAIVDLISNILDTFGYTSLRAILWTDAVDAIQHQNPALILLDLKMPTIEGPSLLKFIRENGFETPVLIVSGFVTESTEKELSGYGVSGIVSKPFSPEGLTDEIRRILDRRPPSSGPHSETARQAPFPAPSTASRQASPSMAALYDRPPQPAPAPEPERSAPSALDPQLLNALRSRIPPVSPNPDRSTANVPSMDLLYTSSRGSRPASVSVPAQLPVEGEVLKVLQKLDTPKASSTVNAPPAPPSSGLPQAGPSSPPKNEGPMHDSLIEPAPSVAPSSRQGLHSLSPPPQPHAPQRRRSAKRRDTYMMGMIALACVVVAGLIALVQWYGAQVDVEDLKAKAQRSMIDQAIQQKGLKEQLLKELEKGK